MSSYSKQRTTAEQNTLRATNSIPRPRFTRAHPVGGWHDHDPAEHNQVTEHKDQAGEVDTGDIFLLIFASKKAQDSPSAALSTSLFLIPFPLDRVLAGLPAKTIIVKSAYRESRSIRFRALNKQQLNVIPAQRKFSVLLPLLAFVGFNAKDKATARKSLFHVVMRSGLRLCS